MRKAGKLYRSRDGYIGGVCAGVADRLDLDPILARVFAVLFAVTTLGIGVLVYALMWIALPLEPRTFGPLEVQPEHVESSNYGDVGANAARDVASGELSSVSQEEVMNTPLRLIVGISILALFMVLSHYIAPFVRGTSWWQYWPLAIIIAGFALIVVPIARAHTDFWHLGGAVLIALGWTATPIALQLLSPMTLVNALHALWPLLVVSVVLFAVGIKQSESAIALVAVTLLVAFCFATITQFCVPGTMDDLVLLLPDGSSRLMLRGPHL